MVCVPCIVIPFFLFLWHKYLQPYVLKFWNPWKKVEDKGPQNPIKLSCPMRAKVIEGEVDATETNEVCPAAALHTGPDKKTD